MSKDKRWGGWELVEVVISRENLDDTNEVEVRSVRQSMALPTLEQHCGWKSEGRADFFSCMGVDIPVQDGSHARILEDAFRLHYSLGAMATRVNDIVHAENHP